MIKHVFLLAASVALIFAAPPNLSLAQKVDEPEIGSPNIDSDIDIEARKLKPAKPAKPAKPPFQLAKDLDSLFNQLKRTREQKRAKRISEAIWAKWHRSDSRSVDLLTTWARSAAGKKSYGQAMDLLDQVVVMRPGYAEGFNQRATVHFLMNNYSKSIADIERTLALEPRHFGALAGLANILERIGEKEKAMETWYRVLAVYPAMKNAQTSVLRLEEELAGNGI